MADTAQLVKDKLSIIEVVTPYVKLAKAGKYMRGLSPFTKEKTPSFFVSPDRGTYYCFSTSQGGDIFTFVEKMEGVDFRGALKILAEKAGVQITAERPEDRGRVERLREAMASATEFFANNLAEGSDAYAYAKSRGLTDEVIRSWSLGFAPDTWRALLEKLEAPGATGGKAFTNTELIAAGLIKEADGRPGTWYDRFRNRLMFPIRDMAGRTVAFTGRALAKDDQAKYLNSPETELFKKSEVLFGMDRAKDSIRSRGFAILVEGQFDLLLLHQIGFQNTIALSGTALSSQHLALIKRYAENLMLCLDSDKAGLAASSKSAEAALRAGMRVKAVRLPAGKDPADLASEDIKNSTREFARRVSDAQSIVEFFLSVLAASETDQHKLVLAAEQTVLPLIAAVQSPLEREHFVGITARALATTPEAVRASLTRLAQQSAVLSPRGEAARAPGAPTPGSFGPAPLSASSSGSSAPARTPPAVPAIASLVDRRGEFLLSVATVYADHPLAETLKNEYNRIIGAEAPDEPISERALFEAGLAYGEPPTDSEVQDLVRIFEKVVLSERLKNATNDLRRAEAAQDTEVIASLVGTLKELSVQLSKFS
jgi:DNA primase